MAGSWRSCSLDGRVAVVTGGSSGIGEAMASALALAGAQVVIVATPLTQEVASDPAKSAALAARTHTARNGEPSDFAGVPVFLASTASDYVTGQTIYVDGGFSGA